MDTLEHVLGDVERRRKQQQFTTDTSDKLLHTLT